MALSHAARKRLSLLILVIGMPLYVVVAVSVVNWADARWGRLPFLAEMAVYIVLGLLWALPFRSLFRGVGQADPNAETDQAEGPGPSA
ncbi:DUF2842 domain-containing protein [Pseudogemmobacter blasticus]|uniref:DUF2842 domain-containing protein n=1 Tax=Fuscovulum blasticum DSM 2131 TaxID=1188250 RepID=A0A2T4JE31_FUSBL|nr:DUF2842 domain-containing protein [Fuscovulum blasticum]PTE16078.1 DUF2842 domain-containing protein [Fuscovulum blasticum DSM 2131]